MISDQRKEEITSIWMECWTTKKFPLDMVPSSYTAWKKFLNYWYMFHSKTIEEAFNDYLVTIKNIK